MNSNTELSFALEKAKPAKVIVNIKASPPPYHKVRMYSTAEQTGPHFWNYHALWPTSLTEFDGNSITLDLFEDQSVDYLYTVVNDSLGTEQRDGRPLTRHFLARDGLIVNDTLGEFFGRKHFDITVKVPSHTDPEDFVGLAGSLPGQIIMHPRGNNEWTVWLPDWLAWKEYFYFKTFHRDGREAPAKRVLDPNKPVVQDVVQSWYYESDPAPVRSLSPPTPRRTFEIFAYPPDYYDADLAFLMKKEMNDIAKKGFHGVVLSQIRGTQPIEPLPRLRRQGIETSYFEVVRLTKLAKASGLKTYLFPQVTIPENILHTGRVFSPVWWNTWLDEMEEFNMFNARSAGAAGIDYLMLQKRPPGLLMDPAVRPAYNERMRAILAKMRAVYSGKIVAEGEAEADIDYWHDADIVAEKVLDPLPLTDTSPQSQVDGAIANNLDQMYKWIHDRSRKPFFIHQFNAGGSLTSWPEDPTVPNAVTRSQLEVYREKQVRWLEAVFKAMENRDWVIGVNLFPYGVTDQPEILNADIRGKQAEELASLWAKRIKAFKQ